MLTSDAVALIKQCIRFIERESIEWESTNPTTDTTTMGDTRAMYYFNFGKKCNRHLVLLCKYLQKRKVPKGCVWVAYPLRIPCCTVAV